MHGGNTVGHQGNKRERSSLAYALSTQKTASASAFDIQGLRTVPDPNDNTRSIVFDTFREAALAPISFEKLPLIGCPVLYATSLLGSHPLLLWQQSANLCAISITSEQFVKLHRIPLATPLLPHLQDQKFSRNAAQSRQAFERIGQAIQHQHALAILFFVDGPGRTGKSFLYNTLIAYVLDQGEHVYIASSGIAALILHGGRTAHSLHLEGPSQYQ